MDIFKRFIVLSLAVFATPYVVSGVSVSPVWTALIVGACLLIINSLVKPIISILTLPINILTLGLFSILVNGIIFWILGQYITGFVVLNFTAALFGALFVSVVYWVLSKIFKVD